MNTQVYNTKEKGREIRLSNLSIRISVNEEYTVNLENEIDRQWESIKEKRVKLKQARKNARELYGELNKELKRLADE